MDKYLVFVIFSLFWVLVAVGGCITAKFYKERVLISSCFVLTAVCCWLIWLVTFLMQLNPLIGPQAKQVTILGMMTYWGGDSYLHNNEDE